jgi:hypothetical protein
MANLKTIVIGLLASVTLTTPAALGADLPIKDAACVPVLNNGNHCTSNALSFKAVSIEPDRTHCNIGDEINLDIGITLGSGRTRNAAQRYNLGVWVGEHGEPAMGGTECTFTGLQPATTDANQINLSSGSGPYRLINNDTCGDILDSEITYYEFQASNVLCQDTNGNGKLDVPIVIAWHNNANKDLCSGPTDEESYFPRQSSACREFESYDLDIITVEPPAEIEVYKTPTPRFIRGTSGLVTFEIEVFNESDRTDDLVITALNDDQFGDLAGQGNCAVGGRLAPGARYRCEFQKTLTGTPGGFHENTVTATATDTAGQSVSDTDSARVLFLADTNPPQPDIRVIKTASPHSLYEPGGPVVYQVEVWNDGETDLNLTALDDSRTGGSGSLDDVGSCTLPQFIAKGLSYSCDYTLQVSGRFPGSDTNTVTATAAATETGTVVTDTDTASVAFRDTPVVIRMKKLPRTAVIQARTNVVYEVIIENHSPAKSVTITSLVDNYHGDLTTLGLDCGDTPVTNPLSLTLTADGSSIECTFTGTVPETTEALPTDVTYYPDTVTASGTADDGKAVSAIATAEVQFIPGGSGVAPSPLIEVSKIARPDRVPTTGGAVAFTAEVINASATEAVLIEELVDDIHGNLSGRGNCGEISTASPLEIAAGATHRCTFTEQVKGAEGSIERDTITAYGKGKVSGETVLGFDDAAVQFTGVPLDIAVSKTPSENSTDPGAVVTFTINISNNNDFSVDVNAISDSVFGDLNGSGDCVVPMQLASQSSKACTFQKAVYPNIRPRLHNNVVTIAAQPAATARSDNNFVSASDQAWIAFTRALPGASLPVPVLPHGLLLVSCSLAILWLGRRRWQGKVTAKRKDRD